jgi:RimJ/RimL family protein N-acetyltransferase
MTSLQDVSWPLRTERLTIRRALESDAAAFQAYRRLPEVSDWLPRLSTDLGNVEERFGEEEFLTRTFFMELDGQVVGDLYLSLSDAWAQAEVQDRTVDAQAEIGWALDPAYQGRGLALEGARRLLALCFEELGVHRVIAVCFAGNEASWRLMEKLGMRREAHTVKDSLHRERGWLDGYSYALLADEWAQHPSGQESMASDGQATEAEL